MEKSILFITEKADSFLITAMSKSLIDAGFEVILAPPHPQEIMALPVMPNIFIVYLDGDEIRFNTTLQQLGRIVNADAANKHLYLIGNPIEIEAAYRNISRSLVAKAFQRPVNTVDLITELNLAHSGYSYLASDQGSKVKNSGAEDTSKKSLLLVDDDSTLLRSMQTWLIKKYNVFITNSGINTIAFLRERKVDLILLDYEMPLMSGLEVFRSLKSEPSTADIPVIFLTAKDDRNTVMKVLEVKPANYLVKPVPPSMLMETVDNFFRNQEVYGTTTPKPKPKAYSNPYDDYLEELESV